MANAKARSDWDHTSLLACILANANSEKKKFEIEDFHPLSAKKPSKTPIHALKSFVNEEEVIL